MGAGLGISMMTPFTDAARESDEIQLVRASSEDLRRVGEKISCRLDLWRPSPNHRTVDSRLAKDSGASSNNRLRPRI
jgi:hypothetical protein